MELESKIRENHTNPKDESEGTGEDTASKEKKKRKGGWQNGRPRNMEKRRLQEEGRACEGNNNQVGDFRKRKLKQEGTSSEQMKKHKGGWQLGEPRNPHKRLNLLHIKFTWISCSI